MNYSLPLRLKRLRHNPVVRNLICENRLDIQQFIAPLFINESLTSPKAIPSLPGHFQWSLNTILNEVDELRDLGIHSVLLFGIPKHKEATGHQSWQENGIIQQTIRLLRNYHPDLLIIADLCFCEYTDHGHCGLLQENQEIDNDATLSALSLQAISMAQAGANWVAPSSMTDGMVGAIRQALDQASWQATAIMSYAVKYCSGFYAPFRQAAEGAPAFGDRQAYQINPANAYEAEREAELDVKEGADILMVKPASHYLDIVYRIKQRFPQIPLCAFQVSGEYSLIKQGARAGLIDEKAIMVESLLGIKRAGADILISYFAKEFAQLALS